MALPAIVLLIAVPVYRVHQIPLVPPGFDIEKSVPVTDEARATADLYRRANDLYVPRPKPAVPSNYLPSFRQRLEKPLPQSERRWLAENEKPLALALEASRRPLCGLDVSQSTIARTRLRNDVDLFELVVESGSELELHGDLDGALDRYFAAMQVAFELRLAYWVDTDAVFLQVANWVQKTARLPSGSTPLWSDCGKSTPKCLGWIGGSNARTTLRGSGCSTAAVPPSARI